MKGRVRIPERGRAADELIEHMRQLKQGDADWHGGRTWSMVYYGGDEHHELLRRANNLFLAENALNPMAFASLRRLEHEVVQMTAAMLHGPDTTVGTMTSGGTESILMAVKTLRDRARRRRPWIRQPNLVVPETLHPAFDKAAHYFDLRLRKVEVGPHGQVDVQAMRRAINFRTIALAASAPQYVSGAVDPIPELSELALSQGLPLHIDACFGGFLLPWLERQGVDLPVWDFRNPGVTSMSADVHKFGYAPKGASVILHRDMSFLRHQFFVHTRWKGGIYASPSMQGTRPGSAVAAAWASMQGLGESGYARLSARSWEVAQTLRAGIADIPALQVLGTPHSTVVTWAARDPRQLDVYAVADLLAQRGWSVDRQQTPPSVHCTATATNAKTVRSYLEDLRECTEHALAHPELSKEGEAAMYGMMAKVPVKGLVKRGVRQVLEQMYGPEGLTGSAEEAMGGDGLFDRFMDKYGDRALDVIEKLGR